jgi:hypothetical protein
VKSLLVTGAHHRAVCALYQQQIDTERDGYRDVILELRERAEKSELRVQELHGKVLEMMTAKEAAAAEPVVIRRRRPANELPENFDVNDPKQLFQQARAETGSNNASRVFSRMRHIREQHRPTGGHVQTFKQPTQADVNKMIQDTELEGMTMDPQADVEEAS